MAHPGGASAPPPKKKPLPIPPILKAKAPPASSYTPQSHAQTYAATPHHYTAPVAPVSNVTPSQAAAGRKAATSERQALSGAAVRPQPIVRGRGVTEKQLKQQMGELAKEHAAAYKRSTALKLLGAPLAPYTGLEHTSNPTELPGNLAAVRGAALIKPASGVAGVLTHLAQQVVNLPKSTLISVEELGKEAAHDTLHPLHPETGKGLAAAAKNDAVVKAIEQKSFKPLERDPLGTILDATAIYGLAGKGAGALARSGALGTTAKEAGALGGREAKELLPNVPSARRERGYSNNIITKQAQKVADKAEKHILPPSVRHKIDNFELRQQVAAQHTAARAEEAHHVKVAAKALKKAAKGAGQEEKDIAPIVALTGQNRAGLEHVLDSMKRGEQELVSDPAARERARAALENAFAKDDAGKLDWAKVNHIAGTYKDLSDALERRKIGVGMITPEHAESALNTRRVLGVEPNVHFLHGKTTDPLLKRDLQDAKQTQREAEKNVEQAKKQAAISEGSHKGATRALSQIEKKIPLAPETDNLLNHNIDLQRVVEESRKATAPLHKARIKYLEEVAKQAKEATVEARQRVATQKLHGAVIEDPNLPALSARHPELPGMRVRKMTPDEYADFHAASEGPQSFIPMTNPDKEIATSLREGRAGREERFAPAAGSMREYTGEALRQGQFRSGESALGHALVAGIHKVGREEEDQAFLRRYSVPAADGRVEYRGTDKLEAEEDARQYLKQHGIHLHTIPVGDGWRNVPEAAFQELISQTKFDQPGRLARAVTTPNRLFRHTVLPYSPKLPVMHTAENITRVGLMEHGNPLQAGLDYARARNTFKAMEPAERARQQALFAPGGLSHAGGDGADDLGKLPVQRAPAVEAIKKTGRVLDKTGQQIIRFQRALERHADLVAAGAHQRRLLQEAGHSYLQASLAVKKYSDELARGLATPAEAERAATWLHKTMGQYNAFTGRARALTRLMPFGSWYLNATRLIMVTLPRDHPLFSALLHDTYQATSTQWNAQHQGLPKDLQTAMKAGGGWIDIGKFLPIGLPNENPVTTGATLVLPWGTASLLALAGKDPFGADLYGPDTPFGQGASPEGILGEAKTGTAWRAALEQGLEAFGGPADLAAKLAYQHGGTFYNTDTPVLHLLTGGVAGPVTLKPGSQHQSGVNKALNPFAPIYLNAKGSTAPSGPGTSAPGGTSIGSSSPASLKAAGRLQYVPGQGLRIAPNGPDRLGARPYTAGTVTVPLGLANPLNRTKKQQRQRGINHEPQRKRRFKV